jgi:hypothetical protein
MKLQTTLPLKFLKFSGRKGHAQPFSLLLPLGRYAVPTRHRADNVFVRALRERPYLRTGVKHQILP